MEFRRICDDTSDMGMWELAHNHVFIKNGEAWYRDFEREISVRDLMREICSKHGSPADADEMDNETLDEVLTDNLQYGTDDLEGVFAMFYTTLYGMADVRAWLEVYEKHGLPTTMRPAILQQAVDTYGKEAQTDMAIEEMSELSKALLKHRRAEKSPEAWDYERTKQNIYEEIADVIIMLTQLLMIYGGREEIQKDIDSKVSRLAERLKNREKEAEISAAHETLQPTTAESDNEKEKSGRILLRLHNAGGCGARDEYATGWDEAITEAIRIVEEETGTRIEEMLD